MGGSVIATTFYRLGPLASGAASNWLILFGLPENSRNSSFSGQIGRNQ
jgi:hypothetical protein